jgi:formylglycine-generating enzyme required for sulfatase activity
MGCVPRDRQCFRDEKRHTATVSRDFEIMAHEVTVARFRRYDEAQSTIIGRMLRPRRLGLQDQPDWSERDHPVVYVSWDEAREFCEFVDGRLPTEAEWEYAARGGNADSIYPWGMSFSRDRANGEGTGGADEWDRSAPVGSFPPNGDLYDMVGNV